MSDSSTQNWSNFAKLIYKRTYARDDNGVKESWPQTIERMIRGNLRVVDKSSLLPYEGEVLENLLLERKSGPGGRGYWFSGSPQHERLGGEALNNCWYFSIDDWQNLVLIQDMLMLGGGTGASVEHRFVSKLPHIRNSEINIVHEDSKDADFIVPDSREGWCELLRKTLESFFVTGRSFSYSTICLRGAGEKIKGFGGKSSGPLPLVKFVNKITGILKKRQGKHVRPIDMADVVCCIGEMVKAGNVRRSAIILLGDPWDKEYLIAKRWDMGSIPPHRSSANWSIVTDDIDDVHPLFWKTYENGEPFGIVNRTNIQKYARMGEEKYDSAVGVNPCAEATVESGESCNLQEQALTNMSSPEEFFLSSRLMHRWGKRVTMENYSHDISRNVIAKNRRIGTSITGCLGSDLFKPDILDEAYRQIQEENVSYSSQLGIPTSIRTTVVKPSGTLSKIYDCGYACGIHPAFSRFIQQTVRLGADDPLVPLLRQAGYRLEPEIQLDGSTNHDTLVAYFYVKTPEGVPAADEDFGTWRQLDTLLMAQKHWADQAVSVTVYYYKKDIPEIKSWLKQNLNKIKTISFLCHNDHGFKQAPWSAITEEEYKKESGKIKELDMDNITGDDIDLQDCEGGACPVK